MSQANDNDTPADKSAQPEAGQPTEKPLTEAPSPGDERVELSLPASSTGADGQPPDAAALVEANQALRAVMDELREARDRLCLEADEFEKRVKERTAELEAIISSLPDAVYIGDEDGIFRCNQAALDVLGFANIAQLQAQGPTLLAKLQNRYADTGEPIAPDDEAFSKALCGEPWTVEILSRNLSTGQDAIYRSAANPIVLDGEVVGAVSINSDITEQKRTEQALRAAVQRLSEREAALVETAEQLQEVQDQLEARVAERTAALTASQAQLRTLSRRLVEVQEAERRTLARDLHDTSGAAMTLINMGLGLLKRESGLSEKAQARIEELRSAADSVAEDLHRLSVNLRPSSLDRYGLVPALEDLINSVRKQAGIEVDFQVEGLDERLPGDLETTLYRIVQEATTNLTRYAAASHASISLRREGDVIGLEVADNGRGFDVDEAVRKGRLGLLGMRERAEMLCGTFDLQSAPGSGATLYVRVPVVPCGADQDEGRAPTQAAALDLCLHLDRRAEAGLGRAAEAVDRAAELARAKALSDKLVEIMAGMVRQGSTSELLAFVLARSAEAIDCGYAIIALREEDHWVVSHGYQLPESIIGQRLSDEDVPVAAQIERTRKMMVVNSTQSSDPLTGPAHALGVKSGAGIPLEAGGQFVGVVAYVHNAADVTFAPSEVAFLERLAALVALALENLQLHAAAEDARRTLEALLTNIPEGITIVGGPPDFQILMVSQFGQAIAGKSAEELSGHQIGAHVPAWDLFLADAQTRPQREQLPLYRATRQGEVITNEEWVLRRPDGEKVPILCNCGPITDSAGKISGALMAFRDIRTFKAAEAAARGKVEAQAAAATAAQAQTEALAAERAAILDAIADALIVYDLEGRIVRQNAVAQELLGYNPQTQGATIRDRSASVLHPRRPDGSPFALDEFPAVRALRGEVVRGVEMILQVPARRGGELHVSVSAAPIQAEDGRVTGAVATFTSIEAYYQANERLRQANAELEAILAALDQGLVVYDTAGRIVRMNKRGQVILGYSAADLQLPQPERVGVLSEGYRTDGSLIPREETSGRRALQGEVVRDEEQYVHFPAAPDRDFWAIFNAAPIFGPNGEVTGAVITWVDTSGLHAVTEQLRQANAELEAVLDSIPDGLIVNALDGRVRRMNPVAEEMLRYTPEERTLPMSERIPSRMSLFRPDGTPYPYDEYPPVRALAGEIARSQELIMRSAGSLDRDLRVLASAGPIRTEQGELLGAVTILTDISDLHETRTRLEEANTALVRQADELRAAGELLEQRVQERTASLQQATGELERTQAELQALSRRLVQMQEEERSFVADQLYNQAAQVLAALKMQLWSLEKRQQHAASAAQLADMKMTLDQTIQALHDLAAQLRPASLDRLTVTTLLRDYASRYVQAQGLSFQFEATETDNVQLPSQVLTAVFRTVQEALANIIRHASATEVTLTLRRSEASLIVSLSDNGVGFDPRESFRHGGVGLIGMRERLESVQGKVRVDSTSGGTTVTIAVPLAVSL